jgi:TolA-binding protein
MLKLGKTSWVILSIGIFIVIGAGLGFTRNQQLQEQNRLDEELTLAEKRINNLQIKELREQEDALQASLEESAFHLQEIKESLHQTVVSADIVDEFYRVAYAGNVEVIAISTSSVRMESIEGLGCSAITVNADVKGAMIDLISLVASLNNDFATGVVKSARLNVSDMDCPEGTVAVVQITVYSYDGA